MAINPAEVTTVRASELPPSPPDLASILVHELGGILNRMTLDELINYIGSQATSRPYEVKCIYAPDEAYITDNFDMTPSATQGLGKHDGLWSGWAICNGNNGTANLDGQTLVGYGANFNTVGQFIGSPDAVLVSHNHTYSQYVQSGSNSGSGGEAAGYFATGNTSTVGESGIGKNYQPSMTILIIMKLP